MDDHALLRRVGLARRLDRHRELRAKYSFRQSPAHFEIVARSVAMKMVGHRTESIYRRYAIVDEAMLREGAEKLAPRGGSVEAMRTRL